MRDRLQSTLGKSLLPFAIREEQQVQDAMRSGLTVIDYAPQSGVVVDLKALGKWVEQLLPQLEFARGMTA
jgi:cellulose biosynthesis protein BcsQ